MIKEPLASGGMADVVHAERRGVHGVAREVCLKRIKPELCTDRAFVEMFIDEARIASTLRHANIVAVEHFDMVDGTLFMAMEWVHGVDASKLLQRVKSHGRTLPLDAVLLIVRELLAALEYAHAKVDARGDCLKIVHRDVSPHNLLVSFHGNVKLTDFGIAKATSSLHHTLGGMIKGKVPYMSPEQATGAPVDRRADLFAVGVTAYELLTGELPHRGSDEFECVRNMLSERRQPLHGLRAEVPVEVEAIVNRLLELAPDERFQSASEALEALLSVPAILTGQRSLQQLLRVLYDDEAFSTLAPRFRHAAHAGAFDATVAAPRPIAFAHDAPRSLAAPAHDDDGPTTVRAPVRASARPTTAPTTRQHRPVDPTPGPIAVMRMPEVSTAAASPRASRSLAAVTAVGATLVLGVGAGSVGTVALQQRAASASATPADALTSSQPESRSLVDADAATPAHLPAPVTSAAAPAPAPPPQTATVTVTAVPWGMLTIDGQHLTETHATWRVTPGRHRISARRLDVALSREIVLTPGERQSLRIVFPTSRTPGM